MPRDFFDDFEFTPIEQASEELKRVDHLIYVSLKYTRTVDMFKSIFERMIATGDFIIEAILEFAQQNDRIDEVPMNAGLRCDAAKSIFSNDKIINDFIEFYQFLRRINRAEFFKSNEFRRHVTMTVKDGDKTMEIKIDTVTEYYKNLKEIFNYIKGMIENKGEEV